MNERRRAIVVGGAGGIGSAICRRMASEGYRVVVADRNLSIAENLVPSLAGVGHHAVGFDVTDEAAVVGAFDAIEAGGPAAVLVVASGGPRTDFRKPINVTTMTTSDWDATLALNLTGIFFCIRKFGQLRLDKPLEHARIISIGSGAGQLASGSSDVGYVASKAALIGFTRQAAFDLSSARITVNIVAPGPVGTPEFLRSAPETVQKMLVSGTLLERLAMPEEIAAGVAFLASSDASYITGTTFDINGGSHMH